MVKFFSPNALQMMTFLDPLDALIPKVPFSFFFCQISGPGHLRDPGVGLGGIFLGPSIEPFFLRVGGGGGSSQRAVSPPPPPPLFESPPTPATVCSGAHAPTNGGAVGESSNRSDFHRNPDWVGVWDTAPTREGCVCAGGAGAAAFSASP